MRWELWRGLTERSIHDACRLSLLEGRLLLLEAGLLLQERGLLLETGRLLRRERVRETRRTWLELLPRRIGEGRAGLLALVQCLLVHTLLLWLAELRLTKLRLRLEAGRLRWHGRVLLRHHAILLLLREATVAGLLRLELLVLLLHLEFLKTLAGRSDLSLLEAGLHRLLDACVLRLDWWWAELGLLGIEARSRCCSGWRWHWEAGAGGLLRRWLRSLISCLLGSKRCNLVEDGLVGTGRRLLRWR